MLINSSISWKYQINKWTTNMQDIKRVLTSKPKNEGKAYFLFSLVSIAIGGILCWLMGELAITYVAISVVLLAWGVACWVNGKAE